MRMQHKSSSRSSKRKQKRFPGLGDHQAHSAARTLTNADAPRQCSGATLVALPIAWNAAPAA